MPYVIAVGDRGIYDSWEEVKAKKKLIYKKFDNEEDIFLFMAKIFPEDYESLGNNPGDNILYDLYAKLPQPILDIYTDGSSANGMGGYGIYFSNTEVSQAMGLATNNEAEEKAILVAIEMTQNIEGTKIIHTDSCTSIYRHYAIPGYYFHYIKAHTNLSDRHSAGNKRADFLAAQSIKDIVDRKFTFGKHKGRKFSEVNKEYLLWCVEKKTRLHEEIKAFLESRNDS